MHFNFFYENQLKMAGEGFAERCKLYSPAKLSLRRNRVREIKMFRENAFKV